MTTPSQTGSDRGAGGRFARGNKLGRGNPRVGRLAAVQRAIVKAASPADVVAVLQSLHTRAVAGDVAAAVAWLRRVLGAERAEPEIAAPIGVDLGRADLDAVAAEIGTARSAGHLTDAQATAALAVVEARQRIREAGEIERRLVALEARAAGTSTEGHP